MVYNGPNGGRRYSVIPLALRGGLTEETKKNRYALVYFEGSNTVNLLRMDRVVWTQVSNESFDLEAVIKKYGKDPRIQAESNATSSYQVALRTAMKLSDGKAKEPNLDKIQQVASAHATINPDEGAWLGRIGKLLKLTYSDQTITSDEIAQLLQLSEGEGLNQPAWVEEEYGDVAQLISGPRISAILHVAGKDCYGIHCFWVDDDRPIKTLPKANDQHKENDKGPVLPETNDTASFS
ncbi:MAG: hypothetical protein BroJett011_08100 [Chloroflexota bacterium]|nr:MAG: hypothetical protein BroJett011_08100 [Chloroflexota bacterium]